MKMCTECLRVNGHHPNCPEADDYDDTENDMWEERESVLPGDRDGPEKTDNR